MSFFKLNPDLKNARALARFKDGRKARFHAELLLIKQSTLQSSVEPRLNPLPLYSHNATWQGQFRRGWESITPSELAQFRYKHKATPPHAVNVGSISSIKHPYIDRILNQHQTRSDHVAS